MGDVKFINPPMQDVLLERIAAALTARADAARAEYLAHSPVADPDMRVAVMLHTRYQTLESVVEDVRQLRRAAQIDAADPTGDW